MLTIIKTSAQLHINVPKDFKQSLGEGGVSVVNGKDSQTVHCPLLCPSVGLDSGYSDAAFSSWVEIFHDCCDPLEGWKIVLSYDYHLPRSDVHRVRDPLASWL